jgi:hypothetical protein
MKNDKVTRTSTSEDVERLYPLMIEIVTETVTFKFEQLQRDNFNLLQTF